MFKAFGKSNDTHIPNARINSEVKSSVLTDRPSTYDIVTGTMTRVIEISHLWWMQLVDCNTRTHPGILSNTGHVVIVARNCRQKLIKNPYLFTRCLISKCAFSVPYVTVTSESRPIVRTELLQLDPVALRLWRSDDVTAFWNRQFRFSLWRNSEKLSVKRRSSRWRQLSFGRYKTLQIVRTCHTHTHTHSRERHIAVQLNDKNRSYGRRRQTAGGHCTACVTRRYVLSVRTLMDDSTRYGCRH